MGKKIIIPISNTLGNFPFNTKPVTVPAIKGDEMITFDHVKIINGIGKVGLFVVGTQGPFEDGKIQPICNLHDFDSGKFIQKSTVDWDNCLIIKTH